MKKHCLALLSLLGFSMSTFASEVATFIGSPDPTLSEIKNMQLERVTFGLSKAEDWVTTYMYSLLGRRGIQSATAFEVINGDGGGSTENVDSALEQVSAHSPIALVPIGGFDMDSECKKLAKFPDVAFVLAQKEIQLDRDPSCAAANILLVAAHTENPAVLAGFSGSGPGYRIAAPYKLPGKGPGNKELTLTGVTPGATIVAAQMARFRRNHRDLYGANLIERFLRERTDQIPQLTERVKEGRIVRDSLDEVDVR